MSATQSNLRQHETVLNQLSNDAGVIDVQQPEVDVEIDVRDEETSLYEADDGRLFLETPAHANLLEVVPSYDGPQIEVASVTAEQETLTELRPADPAEQDDVSNTGLVIEIRAD